jgi:putative spermidine/putrescine transport system substrate-binding protein
MTGKKSIGMCILVFLCGAFVLMAASKKTAPDEPTLLSMDFSRIESLSEGTKVTFYMWGGSSIINRWVDSYVGGEMKKRYDVTLERVPMDASIFVNKLLTEKQAGRDRGTIDLLWINGENFKNAREADLLFGPYVGVLPNYRDYVDPETVAYDFGYPTEGYEAPYGRAQFVFEYDSAKVDSPPDTYESLLRWVKENPGRFTYPMPPDFTGSAFIRQAFYAVTGGYAQYVEGFDEELFRKNAPMLWAYLSEMKPYLWQEGKTYPKDVAALDTLFARGEVDLNMSYNQTHAQNSILTGLYRDTVKSYVMKNDSIYNTHFTAIPFNAPNKAGALATTNFLLSVEAQVSKNMPENWGDFTVLDMDRLSSEQRAMFESIDLGDATVALDVLASNGVPEIPASYLEKLEAGWEEEVLRQ